MQSAWRDCAKLPYSRHGCEDFAQCSKATRPVPMSIAIPAFAPRRAQDCTHPHLITRQRTSGRARFLGPYRWRSLEFRSGLWLGGLDDEHAYSCDCPSSYNAPTSSPSRRVERRNSCSISWPRFILCLYSSTLRQQYIQTNKGECVFSAALYRWQTS